MDVFISWSREKSRAVAEILRVWLPDVVQSVDPFVSSTDIGAGQRWSQEVATQLEGTRFGIICVTAENQAMPWINFEAGALAKAIDTSRVVPLLVDLSPTQLTGPLAQFQAKALDRAGLTSIARAINGLTDPPLAEDRLDRAIERTWADVEAQLEAVRARPTEQTPPREDREVLEEILARVREITNAGVSEQAVSLVKSEAMQKHKQARLLIKRRDPKAQMFALDDGLRVRLTDPALLEVIERDLAAHGLADVPLHVWVDL